MLEGVAPRLGGVRQVVRPAVTAAGLQQLAIALLVGALAETILLRLVTRVGVHLPKDEAVSEAFGAASFFGSIAFNFASLLAMALVVLLLASLVTRVENGLERGALAVLSAATLAGLALSLVTGAPAADALFGVAVALLVGFMALVVVGEMEPARGARLALALIVAAYFCYQYYVLSHLFYRMLDYGALPPASIAVLRLGELLAVAAAVAAFRAWGLPRWRRIGTAGVAAVAAVLLVLTAAGLSPVSTMAILALWTSGLSLVLPFPFYLVALALYLLTLVACWRSGDSFWTFAGLLLVLLAGYMPEATYHHLLLLLGVAFLSGAVRRALPEPAVARSGLSLSAKAEGATG